MIHNKEAESETRFYGFIRAVSVGLTHIISIAFPVFIFGFFMTEAILLFSPHGSFIKRFPHKTKGRVHWILQSLCGSCAVLGLAAVYYNKNLNGKAHFTSWHGLLGLITVCVVCVQSLAAMPLIYHSLAKDWSLAKLKRYHAASGLVTFLLGCTSLLLGLCSSWFTASVGGYAWYLAAICPALSALIIMNQVSSAYVAKKRLQS
uniref:ascorbate ferrireductase (transmembrane) n=1 Tax=Xiphophorus couchianus TaxID=32473 RepID=A0A3B5L6G5_9TELE